MVYDVAETSKFEQILAEVGKSLDIFIRYEHPDPQTNKAEWEDKLLEAVPETGIGIDATIHTLCKQVIPHGSAVSHPGFTSYITTGPTTISVAAVTAALIAAPQRQTLHAFNLLEELSLEWMASMFELPGHMKGVYSSGGSVANLIALGAARQYCFEQLGIDPAESGISQHAVIYASSETHHTIKRAAGVLGIGRDNVINIPLTADGRMDTNKLSEQLQKDKQNGITQMAVVATAGTTNTGTIDELDTIGKLAHDHGIWFHVDGAYGLPGILNERVKALYQGLELADSVIVDPHKWLGAGVGIAATYVRDRSILARAFTQEHADYLEGSTSTEDIQHSLDSFGIPYFDFGVELSSPSRGVVVWAMLKESGVAGLRNRMRRHNDMARLIAERAKNEPNLELLLEPTLSICCFRFVDDNIEDLDEFNRQIHRRLIRDNKHIPSTTIVNNKLAIRPCFIGERTTPEYAERLVDEVLQVGRELLS